MEMNLKKQLWVRAGGSSDDIMNLQFNLFWTKTCKAKPNTQKHKFSVYLSYFVQSRDVVPDPTVATKGQQMFLQQEVKNKRFKLVSDHAIFLMSTIGISCQNRPLIAKFDKGGVKEEGLRR